MYYLFTTIIDKIIANNLNNEGIGADSKVRGKKVLGTWGQVIQIGDDARRCWESRE
jgi:hypothetical protein